MNESLGIDFLKLAAVAILVLANAFFVAAEFALVSVRRTRVSELIAQGNARARWVERATQNPDRFIAATQLGITMASLGLGWIGEPALGHLLQPIIRLFPSQLEDEVSRSLSAALAFAIITFLHVVVGELAPKSIALQDPERTSLFVARPTVWTAQLFAPAIWLLNGAGNALLKLLRISPASPHQLAHSIEELKMLVSASAESGVVADDEEEMLHAVFDLGETLVRQVMVPRTEVVAVSVESTIEDLIDVAVRQPHTKMPVYEGNLDHIVGVVHVKDVLRAFHGDHEPMKSVRSIMREAIFVPESARINTLLSRFRARKQQIAIVLDEYGGTGGVVTLEDLLEEIVGEVGDPFDEGPDIQPQPDGTSLLEGLTPLQEVNEHFGLTLRDPHYDTIAGYLLGRLGRMAQIGDTVLVDGVRLRVEALDGQRIARISLVSQRSTPPPQPGTAG